MPRRPRYVLPDGLFHVTGRAVFGASLFEDDRDRAVFLRMLLHVVEEFGLECAAYCLLGTHYHLLVSGAQPDLSVSMHRLNGRYARHFNARYRRRGHVFGDRFSAYVVRDDRHFEKAMLYIQADPVKAGLARTVAEWPWTWDRGDRRAARPRLPDDYAASSRTRTPSAAFSRARASGTGRRDGRIITTETTAPARTISAPTIRARW